LLVMIRQWDEPVELVVVKALVKVFWWWRQWEW
jgi:hypothetical protein